MTPIENAIAHPDALELWTHEGGVWWMDHPENEPQPSVRQVAQAMNAVGARFVTITAYQLPGEEGFWLDYHWDHKGRLLGFDFPVEGKATESIFDLCEAADWIEREVHEGFGIDFTGREYEPLLLRQGDTAGVNLRETPAPAKPAPAAPQEVKQ